MQYRTWIAAPREFAEFVEADQDWALSQTAHFGEAVARAYGEYTYQPRVFEFSGGQRVLLPLVRVRRRPHFLRCFEAMPFSLSGAPGVLGGPLGRNHLVAILDWLRPDLLLLNGGATCPGLWESSGPGKLLETIECSSHVMGLSEGMHAIWSKSFTAKARNHCRAAERKGVEVRGATGVADLENYYSIYEVASARWGLHAAPLYSRALFRELATLLGRGVELKLAYVQGRPIAGILLLHGRRSTLYWGAAMLKEFGSYSPHNALLRASIEEACERGMTQFDFGGSPRLESVRAFKESFGARPVRYCSYAFTSTRYRLVTHLKELLPRSERRTSKKCG